jgi:hypothetical protein
MSSETKKIFQLAAKTWERCKGLQQHMGVNQSNSTLQPAANTQQPGME